MSEMVGYEGKIYMTHPTKAICPIMLVSYSFVMINFSIWLHLHKYEKAVSVESFVRRVNINSNCMNSNLL